MSPDPRIDPVPWHVYARDREEDQRDRQEARRELREDFEGLRDAITASTAETNTAVEKLHARVSSKFDALNTRLEQIESRESRRAGVALTFRSVPVALGAIGTVVAVVLSILAATGTVG